MKHSICFVVLFSLLIFGCEPLELTTLPEDGIPLPELDLGPAPVFDNISGTTVDLNDLSSMRFTVDDMQTAYRNLQRNPTSPLFGKGSLIIQPTHIYYRFFPTDTAQVNQLLSDPDLDLSTEPFSHLNIDFEGLMPENSASSLNEDDDLYFQPLTMSYYAVIPANKLLPIYTQSQLG